MSTLLNPSIFATRTFSDELIDSIQYWSPPLPELSPKKNGSNSSVRIAAIVGERLFEGFRFESVLLTLTPENWKEVLLHGEVDFILIESSWRSVTGHWYLGQSVNRGCNEILLEIVAQGKALQIPTVYWVTEDRVYHSHYKEFAANFDYVFCADPKEKELLNKEGLSAELLLPAIQPAVYNGFTIFDPTQPSFSIDLLLDDFVGLHRKSFPNDFIARVIPYGLKIIESSAQVFATKTGECGDVGTYFLGSVTGRDRINTLKCTRILLTIAHENITDTRLRWQALEAIGCGVPVIHLGDLVESDVCYGLVKHFVQENELLTQLEAFKEDDFYRRREAHLAWRQVYLEHTFEKRLKQICELIGITHDIKEIPLASIVTPTIRPGLIERCIETFDRQSYPNKELLLVCNSHNPLGENQRDLLNQRDDIHVLQVPKDKFAGACMNVGIAAAQGKYCFRMDDDDFYGENYLLDNMLCFKAIDANVAGTLLNYMQFEGDDCLSRLKRNRPYLSLVPPEYYGKGASISGNSMVIRKDYFRNEIFHDEIFGAADTALSRQVKENIDYFVILNEFNMIVNRAADLGKHTWRASKSELQRISEAEQSLVKDDLCI